MGFVNDNKDLSDADQEDIKAVFREQMMRDERAWKLIIENPEIQKILGPRMNKAIERIRKG